MEEGISWEKKEPFIPDGRPYIDGGQSICFGRAKRMANSRKGPMRCVNNQVVRFALRNDILKRKVYFR